MALPKCRQSVWTTLGLLTLTALIAASPSIAAKRSPAHKVSLEDARKIAIEKVPGVIKHEGLEREHGRYIYSFEIKADGETRPIIREINVDAETGKIVAEETEPEPKGKRS